MRLNNVPSRIRTANILKVTTISAGASGEPTQVAEMNLQFWIGEVPDLFAPVSADFYKEIDKIIPMTSGLIDHVKEEEEAGGFDLSARKRLDGLVVELRGGSSEIQLIGAMNNSKPTVKISKDGDIILQLKLNVRVPMSELATLANMVDADIFFTCSGAQLELIGEAA